MRAFLSVFALAAWPAMACDEVSFTVTEWSAKADAPFVDATVTAVIDAPQPIRMAKGFVVFRDALGRDAGAVLIPADLHATPNEPFSWTAVAQGIGKDRLPDIHPADVTLSVRLSGVVYQDGSVCDS